MKSPDDTAARFARLRRLIVDSWMAEDDEMFAAATEEARRMLTPIPNRRSEAQLKVAARKRVAKEKHHEQQD